MLASYRILDLAQGGTALCGKMLADLGARVIKVEQPGGDPSRSVGPFFQNIADEEKSLYWWAYNTNKQGITLNIQSKDGQDIFKRLVGKTDVVIESYPPGFMDQMGIGYTALSEINPKIIVTSITPFGQTGQYKNRPSSDLILTAMGGLMYIIGYPDRAPLRISFPQAALTAGAEAAVATMVPLYYREKTGIGQHVDVSAYQCQIVVPLNTIPFWELRNLNVARDGIYRGSLGEASRIRYLWKCKDGYAIVLIYGSKMGAKSNKALVQWMESEGMADGYIKNFDWDLFDQAAMNQEQQNRIEPIVEKFLLTHTKEELLREAVERGIFLGVFLTTSEILKDQHVLARDFWVKVDHPELGKAVIYPGPWAKSTKDVFQTLRRAPLVGEHNELIYQDELGIDKDKLVILKRNRVI
jgi:benzylsuccinate CoA-transferase BbsE subunit/naphthyl-2-methylsuccinate CoA transferase subunit